MAGWGSEVVMVGMRRLGSGVRVSGDGALTPGASCTLGPWPGTPSTILYSQSGLSQW